jgi:O-antigen biosynthesis protein
MIDFAERYPIVTAKPEYLQLSAWTGHIPFAMLMVDLVRPSVFVELGTYFGVSYMAVCQAVKTLNVGTRCYAVDTWKGDAHTGPYADDVLATLRTYHDRAYQSFSTLIQTSFDEAVTHFTPLSVDLLHIDGYHVYEAVRHDFETWKPMMSDRGVMLLHDTCEHNEEHKFGVWRLWDELSREYPSFNFNHEHGLGVLAVGGSYAPALDLFFKATPEEQALIRGQFCELAVALKNDELILREALARGPLEAAIRDREAAVRDLGDEIAHLRQSVAGQSCQIAVLQQRVADFDRAQLALSEKLSHVTSERDLLRAHLAVVQRQRSELEAELTAITGDRLFRFVRDLRRRIRPKA